MGSKKEKIRLPAAAEMLEISIQTMGRYTREGRFKSATKKWGTRWEYDLEEIEGIASDDIPFDVSKEK